MKPDDPDDPDDPDRADEEAEPMKTTHAHSVLSLSSVLVLWFMGCGVPAEGGPAPDAAPPDAIEETSHRHHAAARIEVGEAAEHSVYLLPSSWKDRTGRTRSLDELAGRVQVVAMLYTHCSVSCPRLLATMKRLEAMTGDAGLADRVGFTVVSLDPARDTPERLATFAESVRLDPERWTLLTGGEGDVRALSVLLGVKYRGNPDGSIDHSNVVTVLDPGGVPVDRLEGLAPDTRGALDVIRSVLDE